MSRFGPDLILGEGVARILLFLCFLSVARPTDAFPSLWALLLPEDGHGMSFLDVVNATRESDGFVMKGRVVV